MKFAHSYLVVLMSVLISGQARSEALNLSGACAEAFSYDARLRIARAETDATRQEIGKARAGLLPNIQASASRGRNTTTSTVPGYFGSTNTSETSYNSIGAEIVVKQPILSLSSVAAYRQSRAIAEKSESMFRNEQATLILRTAEAYFNILYTEDNLEFTRSQVTATQAQMLQAKRRFRDGYGTVTEINEAEASYDMAVADDANNVMNLDFYRRELEHITGIYSPELRKLDTSRLVLENPDPEQVDSWIETARHDNPEIEAARQEVKIADREVTKKRAGRYPEITLSAGRSYQNSENNYTIGSKYDTWSVGLQASIPIYTSGYLHSSISQAVSRRIKAREQLRLQEQSTISDIRKYFNVVVYSIAQVKAYEQAVKSRVLALDGAVRGYQAGLRSNVDVLDAQQKLLESRRSLAKSRYSYILSYLSLRQSAGILSRADLDKVNGWLK